MTPETLQLLKDVLAQLAIPLCWDANTQLRSRIRVEIMKGEDSLKTPDPSHEK